MLPYLHPFILYNVKYFDNAIILLERAPWLRPFDTAIQAHCIDLVAIIKNIEPYPGGLSGYQRIYCSVSACSSVKPDSPSEFFALASAMFDMPAIFVMIARVRGRNTGSFARSSKVGSLPLIVTP